MDHRQAQAETPPLLVAVVCTYNRPDELEAMLVAIGRQTRQPDHIVIVDTSDGGSVEGRSCPAVQVPCDVIRTYNVGPSGGFRRGMERVLEMFDRPTWILLLDDDDPPVTDDALELVLAFGEEHRLADRTVAGVGLRGARFDRRRARTVTPAGHGALEVDHLHGGYLATYWSEAVRDIGHFDDRLFWGFEELEYGLRLSEAGYRLLMDGDHLERVRASYPKLSGKRGPSMALGQPGWASYYKLRNLLVILGRRRLWLSCTHVVVVRAVLKPVVALPRHPRRACAALSWNARAIRDAVSGRMGRTVNPQSASR